jgi:hypothetical protein
LRARRKEGTCPLDRWSAVEFVPPAFRPHSAAQARIVDPNTWITTRQLIDDTAWLCGHLPGDIDAVVGVARSGLIPAQQIACMRHLPLLACRWLYLTQYRFDPARDLQIDERTGLLEWTEHARRDKPAMIELVSNYFAERREDE